jgi:hypothetical protein
VQIDGRQTLGIVLLLGGSSRQLRDESIAAPRNTREFSQIVANEKNQWAVYYHFQTKLTVHP